MLEKIALSHIDSVRKRVLDDNRLVLRDAVSDERLQLCAANCADIDTCHFQRHDTLRCVKTMRLDLHIRAWLGNANDESKMGDYIICPALFFKKRQTRASALATAAEKMFKLLLNYGGIRRSSKCSTDN
jgi:hypothetical protein